MVKFIFFGTSSFSVYVLEALKAKNFLPLAVVTFPDKPQGRKMLLTPNPVKTWAEENGIEVIEVTKFKEGNTMERLQTLNADVFVVASFGKIMPASVIYMPKYQTLNVHPSLLPKLRGASPIQTAILTEDHTGVSIMRLDEKMDEGPIILQQEFTETLPMRYTELEEALGKMGGDMLAEILPKWTRGEIQEKPQDNTLATYCQKIEKTDADITNDSPDLALRKVLAFEIWPRARLGDLIITSAHIEDNKLILDKVIPPGKNKMSYEDYLRGNK